MRIRNITDGTGQTGKSVVSPEGVQLEMNPVSFLDLRLRLQGLQRKEKTLLIISPMQYELLQSCS